MNKSPKTVFSLLIPAVIFVAAGAAIFAFQNFSNKRVLSGFAGYVYSKPIFGQNRFEGILIGPSSTGWAWRKEVSKVSITPDTTVEEFDARNGGAILGKDKLPISCKASLVYRLDPSRVKEFMEDYGASPKVPAAMMTKWRTKSCSLPTKISFSSLSVQPCGRN